MGTLKSAVRILLVTCAITCPLLLAAQTAIPTREGRGRPGRRRRPRRRAWRGAAGLAARDSRGRGAPDDFGRDYRARQAVRIADGAEAQRRHGALRLHRARVLRLWHRERTAIQDADRRAAAVESGPVQRPRAGGVDAPERQRVDVPFHPRLHDDVGARWAGRPDEHRGAVRRIESGTLQGPAGAARTGHRHPGAGRGADEVEAAGQPARSACPCGA